MKFKRFVSLLLLSVFLLFATTSCKSGDKISVKSEKTPFVNYSTDYQMKTEYMNTYFIDGGETRYVDATNFMKALKGFYMTSYIRKTSMLFSNNLSFYCFVNTGKSVTKTSVTFSWDDNTISVSDSLFFNLINMSSTTNYSRLLNEKDVEKTDEKTLVFDLDKYGYDIYYKNGKCLVPFSIMNIIFCSNDYYNIYYDGTKYFGVTYDISSYDRESIIRLKTCNLNNKAQTEELRLETYNCLRFVLDYYYGLKQYKGIDDIEADLAPYKDDMLSLDPEVNKQAYYSYFINHLDELHTRIGSYSFYYDPTAMTDNWDTEKTSESRRKYTQVETQLKELSSSCYSGENTYRISGNTAVIYLKNFTTGTDEQTSGSEAYKYDSYEFVKYALDRIATEGSSVTKVVLDLSQNGGGNMGALMRVLGFLSNNSIKYYNYNYLFQNSVSALYDVDIDNDGDFTDNDAYTQYNWYILSSYNTFSAANSFVAMSKSLGATIIGQKSGGGMCSVLPIILPDQTTIEISSNNAQMAELNGEFRMIEGGIEPDISIEYEKFYDINYLNSIL